MEILKGYCAKVRGQQKWQDTGLQDELFALFKLAWLENARLLARRKGQNYYFLASFLSEEEAARFTENFASHKPTAPWLRPFAVADRERICSLGSGRPEGRCSPPDGSARCRRRFRGCEYRFHD